MLNFSRAQKDMFGISYYDQQQAIKRTKSSGIPSTSASLLQEMRREIEKLTTEKSALQQARAKLRNTKEFSVGAGTSLYHKTLWCTRRQRPRS